MIFLRDLLKISVTPQQKLLVGLSSEWKYQLNVFGMELRTPYGCMIHKKKLIHSISFCPIFLTMNFFRHAATKTQHNAKYEVCVKLVLSLQRVNCITPELDLTKK